MATLTIPATGVCPLVGSLVIPGVMAAASQIGRVVVTSSSGWVEASADTNVEALGMLGLIVGASNGLNSKTGVVASGDDVSILLWGAVNLGTVTLALDDQYYLADTTSLVSGLIGNAAGTVSRLIGKPLNTTGYFFFAPQMDVVTP